MTKTVVVLVATGLLGCGGSAPPSSGAPASGQPGSVPAPRAKVDAELVTDLAAPTSGPAASITHIDELALTIDEAGVAHHTGNTLFLGPFPRWIPFSEPVDDVVYLTQLAIPHSVPGAQLGKMFCARTRSSALECVLDFEATPKAARLVRRFRLPVDGPVHHIGVFKPWFPAGGPDRVLCALGTAPSCWSFDWVGTRAEPYTVEPTMAEAAALRIGLEVRAAWSLAAPAVTRATIREVVHTERKDYARIIGDEANLEVHCARLASGELSCFGPGVYGELGDGTLAPTPRVSRPLGDAKVVDVAAVRHHICAVLDDGRVACWGDLGDRMPLPKRHKTTRLPTCTLDRAASQAKFTADLTAAIQRASDCSQGCNSRGLDACLGCVVGCTKVPYLFVHPAVCQEPQIDGALVQRSMTCVEKDQPPTWLTDAELRSVTYEANLTLSPVYLAGVTDAIGVTVAGPSLCVLRRGGQIECVDRDDKLSTKPRL